MSDFIREVDEEYRRDRIVNFLTKYQVALVGLVVAIILGTAAYRFYLHTQNKTAEAANAQYDAATRLGRDGKRTEAEAAFDKIQATGPAGYAMLARMKAVEALAARDPAAGARGFEAIAGDSGTDPIFRAVAQIRCAILLVDLEDPKVFEARYAPMAGDAFPFHSSLRELLALAAFKRNDTEAAGRWLDQIVIDPGAPRALRGRAEAFLSLVASGPAEAGTPEPPKPVVPAPPATTPPVTSSMKLTTPPSPSTPSPPSDAPSPAPAPAH